MIEFKAWPKTPRLNRDMIVTEKIDGTNAAVIVTNAVGIGLPYMEIGDVTEDGVAMLIETELGKFLVAAQSRKKVIQPGKQTDNAGFAQWVRNNAQGLAEVLGDGHHYGEWWNAQEARKALQSGEQKLSLFNVVRYADADLSKVPGLELVPVLYEGRFDQDAIAGEVARLKLYGSVAHPGIKAEGVIVFHVASGQVFKVLCENDELPKGVVTEQEKKGMIV